MAEAAVIRLPERLDAPAVQVITDQLSAARDVAAVVLEGTSSNFCLGMDLVAVVRAARVETASLRHGLEAFARALKLLIRTPRPTLAVVDGPALGGGLGLAAACDVVLATERARFGLPEALYGLVPAIIRPVLLTRLTPQRVNLLLFTCRSHSVHEAAALGLVDRIVSVERIDQVRREILRELRRARSETVERSRSWTAGELEQALRVGVEESLTALSKQDLLETLAADLLEERVPWRR
jgi:enoyl-CoA hydratase/carnithine racemase